jgi:hypothetical protein
MAIGDHDRERKPVTKNTDLKNADQAFADKTGKALEQANEDLDAATLSRLNQARQTALAELEAPRFASGKRWIPATAVAASVLVATVLWLGREPGMTESNQIAEQLEDLDILLSDEDFELYDDLEFYSWLGGELDTLDDEQGQG